MSPSQQSQSEIREHLAEQLDWRLAERDDVAVAQVSSNALPALLFSNVAVMTLLGFNATAVAAGMTTRGQSRRTGKRPYALMDPQTLAETICKSTAEKLEQLFNGTTVMRGIEAIATPRHDFVWKVSKFFAAIVDWRESHDHQPSRILASARG